MTLADQVCEALRRDIVQGRWLPLQPLRMDALRARYGVGLSPLREALNRLQSERLVTLAAQRGFAVAPISRDEMWDAIETRILIETRALARSIARGGDGWEAALVASFHALALQAERMPETPGAGDRQALESRHHAFHQALIADCGSAWLLDIAERLSRETERYRAASLDTAQAEPRDVQGEHAQLLAAALARDSAAATALLEAHYRRTGAFLETRLAAPAPPPARVR